MVFGREREGGASGTEAASLAKPLSVPSSVFGREREGGASGTEAASLAILSLRLPYALWRAGGVAAGVALGEKTGG